MKTFAIKYNNNYLKFGSYRKARAQIEPIKASLYSSERLAKAKIGPVYVGGILIMGNQLQVVEITMNVSLEKVIP